MKNNKLNNKLANITEMLCEVTKELMLVSKQVEHTPVPKQKLSIPNKPVHGNIGKVRSQEHKQAIANGRRKPFLLTIKEPNGNIIHRKYDCGSPCIQMQRELGISTRYMEQLRGGGYTVNRRSNTRHPFMNGSQIELTYLQKD